VELTIDHATNANGRKLRVGVVGCGAVVTLHHLPALKCCKLVDLVALADCDRSWAAKVCRKFGVPECYDDFAAMIGSVEAVLIATPNSTHADIACPLLEAGIHVLCEKPMATSSADVERMFQASARGGGRLMAAHNRRFNANVATVKNALSRGWLGIVKEMSGALGGSYNAADRRTEFRRKPRLSGGGVLIDLGIHLIDLAVCLAGQSPVSVVYDAECAPGWSAETDADVALEFPDGSCASFSVSFTRELDATFTVQGTEGWASASLNAPGHLAIFTQRARVCERAGVQNLLLEDTPSYERQIEHFATAIIANDDFIIQADEVRAGLAIIEQCYSGRLRESAPDSCQSRPVRSGLA
jgi:predicted dehydrogenase